jgi:hypothetical protein
MFWKTPSRLFSSTKVISKVIAGFLIITSAIVSAPLTQTASAGRCNYPDDLDSRGHRCGGRAASERPGGYEPPPQSNSTERSGTYFDGHHYMTMGNSSTGASVVLDANTIKRVSDRSLDFVYYLEGEAVYSQAHCRDNTWITFPEKETHRPQSEATSRLLNTVCSYL